MAAILSNLLIAAKAIELEKFSLIDMPSQGLLVITLAADDKYALLNRDKLTLPI